MCAEAAVAHADATLVPREWPPPARGECREVEADDADAVVRPALRCRRRRQMSGTDRSRLSAYVVRARFVPFDALHAGASTPALQPPWRPPRRRSDCRLPRGPAPRPTGPDSVTMSTVPPPWYSGAPWRKTSRLPISVPVPTGRTFCERRAPRNRDARVGVRLDVDAAVGRQLSGVDQDFAPTAAPCARADGSAARIRYIRGAAHGHSATRSRKPRAGGRIVLVKAAVARTFARTTLHGRARVGRLNGAPSRSRRRRFAARAGSERRVC